MTNGQSRSRWKRSVSRSIELRPETGSSHPLGGT